MKILVAILLFCGGPLVAETVVASRTLPAQTIITPDDITMRNDAGGSGESDPLLFIGMEARVALYAGRPIKIGDVGLPAIVERNQIIPLIFERDGLRITTEGRSLGRAGPGEIIRVLNLTSRSTVSAKIAADGVAYVSQ